MSPRAAITIFFLGLGAAGCLSVPGGDPAPSNLAGKQLTQRELRVRLYDFVVRFASSIEAAADAMAAGASSQAVRINAVALKANAVPACESAAFDSDPVVGLIDVWTLVARLQAYLGSEPGVDDLREQAAAGRAVLDALAAEVEGIALELEGAPRTAELRDAIDAFVAAHPLTGPDCARPSALPVFDLAQRTSNEGLLEVAATADERLDDTADRLTIYTASLPKQARWQAELLTERLVGHPAFASFATAAQDLPTVFAVERAALVEAIAAEREALTQAADVQRLDTLEFARTERIALEGALDEQRVAVVAALDDQRKDTLDAFDAQRSETVAALDEQRVATLEVLGAERAAMSADVDRQRRETLAHLTAEREAILAWFAGERNAAIDYASDATTAASERVLERAFLYTLVLVLAPALLVAILALVTRPKLSIDLARRQPS